MFAENLKIDRKLEKLYPNDKSKLELKKRKKSLFWKLVVILILGIVILLVMLMRNSSKNQAITEIIRNEYLEDGEEVELIMQVEGEESQKIIINVDSVQYKVEEVEELYQMFLGELEKSVLGKNQDWNYVVFDLDFIKQINGYPFTISWDTSDYKLLNREGERIIENMTEIHSGESYEVVVTAKVQYQDFERCVYFFPNLFLSEEEENSIYTQNMETQMGLDEMGSREDSVYVLPEEIAGKKVSFRQEYDAKYLEYMLFMIVLFIGVFIFEREKINRELEERKKDLERMYPELISKMALLLCAGYTIRNAWEKMVLDYEQSGKESFVYEQMRIAVQEMNNGRAEGSVYEKFGVACCEREYRKFSNLLSQNLKRGNKNLVQRMKEESKEANENRRNRAMVTSSKAETKMLIPMMLLLMVVLVAVVLPVFLNI